MPTKLSSAVAGTLAVGLAAPFTTAAAHAAAPTLNTDPDPKQVPQPDDGARDLTQGIELTTERNNGQFAHPLADEDFTFSTGPGPRCIPMQGGSAQHMGQDLVADSGTPIGAVADGTVVLTTHGTDARPGVVVIRHQLGGQIFHSGYLHLWDAETHVGVGDSVQAGETIGEVGDSGPTITPHLHLEIWEGQWQSGTAHDPAEWLEERGVDLRETARDLHQQDVDESCDYVTAEPTPLLDAPEEGADALQKLPQGAELVSKPGDQENGFIRVSHDGQEGWVQQGHIAPLQGPFRVSADEGLNLRSGPGTSHDVIGGMQQGEEVTVTDRDGDWFELRREDGQNGWAHRAYLEPENAGSTGTAQGPSAVEAPAEAAEAESAPAETEPEEATEEIQQVPEASEEPEGSAEPEDRAETESNVKPEGGSEPEGSGEPEGSAEPEDEPEREASSEPTAGAFSVEADYLNARSGPGAENSVVTVLTHGAEREITGRSGEWVSFEQQDRTLWVHTDFLAEDEPEPEDEAAETAEELEDDTDDAGEDVEEAPEPEEEADEERTAEDEAQGDAAEDEPAEEDSAEEQIEDPGSADSEPADSAEVEEPEPEQESETADNEAAEDEAAEAETDEEPAENEAAEDEAAEVQGTARVTQGVNLRSGAGLDHSVMRTVPGDTEVELRDEADGWYQVRAGSETGWIWHEYLDLPAGTGPASGGSTDSEPDSDADSSPEAGGASGDEPEADTGDEAESDAESESEGAAESEDEASPEADADDSTDAGSDAQPEEEPDSEASEEEGSGDSSPGRTGPSSGQHQQSQHGPYSQVWDELAQCEASGDWQINTGNGFFGGLQFTQQSWEYVGGAGVPHEASKQEQIERAHMLWQEQGWNAWPACSAELGLSGDPGGWGDSYFQVHGGTETAAMTAEAGQWAATYSVPLRETPDSNADRLAQIPRGEVLETGEERGSWLQIEYDDDGERLTGWVNTQFVTAA